MDKSLAVLLPVRNAERTIREDVAKVLDVTADLASDLELVVIDDGSKDDTYDIASELAIEYPQLRVVHCNGRRQLAETIQDVRAIVEADVVIVHDGSTRVNVEQLRLVWSQQQMLQACKAEADPRRGVSFADLRRPAQTQPAMEAAHRRLLGFQSVADTGPDDEQPVDDDMRRRDVAAAPRQRKGVGVIPNLPQPNVVGALTDFALGE